MSEAYFYGEPGKEGSSERVEYNELSEQDLQAWIGMVEDELRSFFECATPSERIIMSDHAEGGSLYQNLGFSYATRDRQEDMDFTLIYQRETGTVFEYDPPIIPILNVVTITHDLHSYGMLEEEYIVKIKRSLHETDEAFWNRYYFKRYDQDKWQARVEHIALNFDPLDDEGDYYSRPMTTYDFEAFFKDTFEINTQLRLLLVQ